MIPRSITLRGFLCYRDEQAINLDGYDLWVFSGRNGSGKSAIFDAMRYALFKAHRGGKQEATSLIHTEAAELSICFEFDLGAERYRVKRTVPRKGSAERGVYRLATHSDGSERWPAVPETETDTGLKRWVQENIGLTDETFTASVLLLQGQSESLVGSPPGQRRKVLAGIVDLESYLRIHKRADEKRQCKKFQAGELRSRLRAMPMIEQAAIEEAESQLAECEDARFAAEVDWKRLVNIQAQVANWLDLVGRREKASAKREHARRLIDDSRAIARDWNRLKELEIALPALREAMNRREAIVRLETQSQGLEDESRGLSRKLDLIASLVEDNRRHLATIVEEIERDEMRERAILERQAALAIPIHRARQARALGEEVRRLEVVLESYSADLAARVANLEEEHRLRAGWKVALPSLTALARERAGLAEARGLRLAAVHAIETGTAAQSRAVAALAERSSEESVAREAESKARDRAIEAATLRQAAETRLAEFMGLDSSSTCDRCGQELTPEHFDAEAALRRGERDRAAQVAQDADRTHREARARLDAAEAARTEAEKSLRDAANRIESANRDRSLADLDAERHAIACLDAYTRLDDPFRIRIALEPPDDWAATTFPEARDLDEGRRLAAEVEAFRSQLKSGRAQLEEMESERIRSEQARHTLSAVGLEPGDEAAESEDGALQSERESLARCLKGHATEKAQAERDRAKLVEHDRGMRSQLAETESKLAAGLARSEALHNEADRARAAIPESWRDALDSATDADLAAWDDERRSLQTQDLDALAAELPQAHLQLKQAEAELEDLERQISALPDEARCKPEVIAASTSKAECVLSRAEEERRTQQGRLDDLRRAQQQRSDLASQSLAADHDLAVVETLARLVGPRGIQRDLIRDAERGIVEYANPILREISGGELELCLLDVGDDEPDHALQLEVTERIQGRTGTRGVEYLSGSQKFRVAVSIALAIGQYARGSKERPIESVIIDEGFGGLDRQGRDEMIEQLNALRGRLARIILVSHQEEFAEAFTDGYHLEVVEGSTVARPFHR